MKFKNIYKTCHSYGCVFRKSNPSKRYTKDNFLNLEDRVPKDEQLFDDWMEDEFGHCKEIILTTR